jgi:hypothetical protein
VLAEIQGRAPSVPDLKVDNKSAIALIKNPVLTRQTRHIEVKYHLVRESAARGQISVDFILGLLISWVTLTESLGRIKGLFGYQPQLATPGVWWRHNL